MAELEAFHIAVLAGDGIGPEVMAPALEVLRKTEATTRLKFRFTDAAAGATHYQQTGRSMPESTIKLCDEADAILLGACGLPHIRYPDNTEIAPQIELRMIFDLYAGVRPARLIPGVPSPIVGAAEHGIDLVLIRESTEGLFASMGKGVVTADEARETMVITRKTSQRLFDFSFRLAERRKARGRKGQLACVDKANVFKAFAYFRGLFDEAAARHPDVATSRIYVDACSAMLVNSNVIRTMPTTPPKRLSMTGSQISNASPCNSRLYIWRSTTCPSCARGRAVLTMTLVRLVRSCGSEEAISRPSAAMNITRAGRRGLTRARMVCA